MSYEIKTLNSTDLNLMESALDCFGKVFNDPEAYLDKKPSKQYLEELLAGNSFICLVAISNSKIIGALAAYELKKFEQQRSEIYIYDLAVYENFRRQGVATALIEHLKPIAKERGAWVIYVQADYIDEPAVKLYSKLGIKEKVLHFDISVTPKTDT